MALKSGWPGMSAKLLTLSKCIDKRMWPTESSLKQFPILTFETIHKLENKNAHVERLKDMSADEIGMLLVFLFPFFHMITFHFEEISLVHRIKRALPLGSKEPGNEVAYIVKGSH